MGRAAPQRQHGGSSSAAPVTALDEHPRRSETLATRSMAQAVEQKVEAECSVARVGSWEVARAEEEGMVVTRVEARLETSGRCQASTFYCTVHVFM
jgi:hypothetical protein